MTGDAVTGPYVETECPECDGEGVFKYVPPDEPFLHDFYQGVVVNYGKIAIDRFGRRLKMRLDLVNKSPTGFEWGYCGSGPWQLALALLADAFYLNAGIGGPEVRERAAVRMYGEFVRHVVVRLPGRFGWQIHHKVIESFYDKFSANYPGTEPWPIGDRRAEWQEWYNSCELAGWIVCG